jgi:hypothetical protein
LQSTPRDLATPIREGGGIVEWLWKLPPVRQKAARSLPTATIEVSASPAHIRGPIGYRLSFTGVNYQLDVKDERVEAEITAESQEGAQPYFGYVNGRPMLRMNGTQRELPAGADQPPAVDPRPAQGSRSIPYPELTYLGQLFADIKIYRNWTSLRRSSCAKKENGSTVLKRLERKRLAAWLKTYSLGHLWRKGEIGGNRW